MSGVRLARGCNALAPIAPFCDSTARVPVATASRIPIDIRRFPWIKPFVGDYAFDYTKVAEFFAGDPRNPQAWQEAIARSRTYTRALDAITDIVHAQQQRRGAPKEAIAAAARLRDRQTVAV